MGKSLSTTVNHYNNSYKELAKIDKDVVKIAGGDKHADPNLVDRHRQKNDFRTHKNPPEFVAGGFC